MIIIIQYGCLSLSRASACGCLLLSTQRIHLCHSCPVWCAKSVAFSLVEVQVFYGEVKGLYFLGTITEDESSSSALEHINGGTSKILCDNRQFGLCSSQRFD